MKKTLKLALCLVLVLCTCLCMVACGGDDEGSIAGKYVIYSMDDGSQTIKGDDLNTILSAMGLTNESMYIELNADGTAEMSVFGETAEMAYAAGKIWPVDEPDDKADFSVKDSKLTIEIEDTTMVFTKK
ncbi:MAG: hypothetical protein E7437_00380 [Ruminococcaceae bacterium]|nr:hypothetical protein [Oscillospiraceae bacterium]